MPSSLKRILLGHPLASAEARHERLSKVPALAIFASDNLSSVAYATEEILLVLVLAGSVALAYSPPIGIAIGLLTAIVASSYWQTIHAYPSGGGAYVVAKENLGIYPGLVAGAALLVDYVLTVSVSVAAGVAAITAAFPTLYPARVGICVALVLLIMLANLRGVRETGRVEALNERGKSIKGAKILVLGLAYKKDIDDSRESPSLKIITLFRDKGAKVTYNDPYVPPVVGHREYPGLELKSVPLTKALLRKCDAVVLSTDHSAYDYDMIVGNAPLVIDTRNAVKRRRKNVVKA